MKDIVVEIKVSPYLKEWLAFSFGNPVKLPRRSYENSLLSSLLQKKSNNRKPIHPSGRSIAIVIPYRCEKKPEFYNYLSPLAERKMVAALRDIFKMHLWSDVFPIVNSGGKLNESIDSWCREHGIAVKNREAVRQCFFRLRQNHERYGIILGKKYVKILPV